MTKHETVKSGGVEHCWDQGVIAPVYVPSGYRLMVNMFSSTDGSQTPYYITLNGHYMKWRD